MNFKKFSALLQIKELNTSLPVGISPRNLATRLQFESAVGKLKAELEQRARNLRFGGQDVHAGFGKIEQDAVKFARVRKGDLDRCLHWNANGATAFAAQ